MNSTTRYFCRLAIPGIFTLFVSFSAMAQSLDVISLKKGVKVNGSMSLNTVAYKGFNLEQRRRDPFAFFLSGNLNIDLFGYSAPFSFTYSNTNRSFSQPFNQFHFAPSYKWIRTYTGNTSMTFSPYTLAGHLFYGGGVDLTPGKWRISAMYGRFRKAVPFDPLETDVSTQSSASFRRIGYGMKVGYETNGDMVALSVFTAKDDPSSLEFVPEGAPLTPQQNVAASIAFRKKLFSKFSMNVDYSVSALNTNVNASSEAADSVKQSYNLLKGLLPANTTSRYFDAINVSLAYQGSFYSLAVKYDRIAPEYSTLGAYFFNNDMRNITLAPTLRLFKGKVNLSANAGVQQNNLDKSRASTASRTVGSFQVQATPDDKWNLSANYSNFSSFTRVRPPSDPFFRDGLDTLNFYQVSQTVGGNVSYSFGAGDLKSTLSVNGTFQAASNKAAGTAPPQLSDFINGAMSYAVSLAPADLTLGLSLTANSNNVAGTQTAFVGPALNVSKALLKKTLRVGVTSSYNKNFGSTAGSPVWTSTSNIGYAPTSKEDARGRSSLSLGISLLKQMQSTERQAAFTELTGTVNYTYSF